MPIVFTKTAEIQYNPLKSPIEYIVNFNGFQRYSESPPKVVCSQADVVYVLLKDFSKMQNRQGLLSRELKQCRTPVCCLDHN